MAYSNYFKRSEDQEVEESTLMTQRQIFSRSPEGIFFYELEPAVVVDVIRDDEHPIFEKETSAPKVDEKEWPAGYNGKEDVDYSWIGRVKARMIYSQAQTPTNELNWIYPLECSVKEYPLVNEMIIISKYMGSYYYTRRLNTRNFINHDADFRTEHRYGMKSGVNSVNSPTLVGAKNKSDLGSTINEYGSYLGNYFKANNKIRPLKHFEGDMVFESRFGNSIRFGCYEKESEIDRGTSRGDGESYDGNYGNPQILIRNRQRITVDKEKKFQYNILEDINRDGSSIHITSGKTVSKFVSDVTHEYENVPKPKKNDKGGLSGLSEIAGGKIQSLDDLPTNGLMGGDALPNMPNNLTDLASGGGLGSMSGGGSTSGLGGMLGGGGLGGTFGGGFGNPLVDIGSSLAQGDFGGAVGGGIGMFIGGPVGAQIGLRLGSVALPAIKKFVDAPGSPTSKSPSSRKKFTKAIAMGRFSLNPEYEKGIVNATKDAKGSARSTLKKTKAGPAILGASALGIDIPNANDLGFGPNDSSMFKIFKLAAFGIKSICASLHKKKGGYDSNTEKNLGWLLSLGIDLTLLNMLMDLFARIRGLKFNFGSFRGFNLNNLLGSLCDWANQIEYKSTLLATFRNETNKTMGDKELTKQLGDEFMEKGTYDSYARNYPDFDMQYRTLIGGDLDAMSQAASTFGQTSVALTEGGETKSLVKFDPLTGLFRKKEGTIEGSSTTTTLPTTSTSTVTTTGSTSGLVSSLTTSQDKTTSYFSKKEITRESLKDTVLENADMNAVALLDDADLETLKDTSKVNSALTEAKKAYDKKFDEIMTETEEKILNEPSGVQIFGKQLPTLDGNQIIMSSERILLSARSQEFGIFAKKKFFVTSDDELTFDSKSRFVLRTDSHMSAVAPTVHLGEYITRNHPVLKGDVAMGWLGGLCSWLQSHVHNDPYITTSVSAQQGQLAGLKASLPTLLSTRVFIAG
jgi:hypothetical protein